MNSNLFRKVSLERLSSPEHLDEVLRFTDAKPWVALAAIYLLLIVFVVWACAGSIATTADGQGVIVRRGGVLNVVARAGGLVVKVDVKAGDRIKANQVIATIAQPVLVEQTKSTRQTLDEALRERERSLDVRKDAVRLQLAALDRQRTNAELQISELQEQTKLAKDQITVEEQLLSKGLVTKQQVIAATQKLLSLQDQIAGLTAQLKQFEAQKFELESQPQQEDTGMRMRISNLQRDLAGMEKQLSMAETVASPYGGEVLELKVYPGSTVAAGQPIFSIQPDERNLDLLAYLPSMEAKDTRVGMDVQISPSTIKREEYGFIKGEVAYVSDYPATPAALMRNFENEPLVQALNSSGPVTEIRVVLKLNPQAPSGLQWSTAKGPDIMVSGGTICSVHIVTKRQTPVTLIFPYIKHKLGLT